MFFHFQNRLTFKDSFLGSNVDMINMAEFVNAVDVSIVVKVIVVLLVGVVIVVCVINVVEIVVGGIRASLFKTAMATLPAVQVATKRTSHITNLFGKLSFRLIYYAVKFTIY